MKPANTEKCFTYLVFHLQFEAAAKNARKETKNMFNSKYSTNTGKFNYN